MLKKYKTRHRLNFKFSRYGDIIIDHTDDLVCSGHPQKADYAAVHRNYHLFSTEKSPNTSLSQGILYLSNITPVQCLIGKSIPPLGIIAEEHFHNILITMIF